MRFGVVNLCIEKPTGERAQRYDGIGHSVSLIFVTHVMNTFQEEYKGIQYEPIFYVFVSTASFSQNYGKNIA